MGGEQLAAAHALMARTVGIPARVVVGYLVTDAEVAVTDLHAWVEVPFEGRGWLATEPSPVYADAVGTGAEEPDTTVSTTTTTTIAPDEALEARTLPRQLEPDERPEATPPPDEGISGRTVALVALVVVALAGFLGLVVARVSRRRGRRRALHADTRALGAWAELVDRLSENGHRPPATATIDDVVIMADTLDPAVGQASRPLAAIAAEALHAPSPPTDDRADEAWEHLDEAETALVAARGRTVTARRLTDPRVLRNRAPVPPRR